MLNRKFFLTTCILVVALTIISCNDDGSPTGSGGGGENKTQDNGPIISKLSATTIPIGSKLTIIGNNFSATASEDTVKIGGTMTEVDSASTRRINVTVPKSLPYDKYVVYVRVNGRQSAAANVLSVVSNAPSIESVSPERGGAGASVTITGVNFSSVKAENTVMFDDKQANVTSASEEKLVAEVPEGLSLGEVPITVKVAGASEEGMAPNKFKRVIELISTSNIEAHAWTNTVYVPNYQDLQWTKASYDDSDWNSSEAPFGSDTDGVNTNWSGYDMYLRKTFNIDNLSAITSGDRKLVIPLQHDDWAHIYINGVQAVDATGANGGSYDDFSLTQESIDALQEGENIIAVHAHDNGGGQIIDLGLYEEMN